MSPSPNPEPPLEPGEPLDSLPRRAFLASSRRPRVDEHGFVLPLPETESISASDLLRHSAVLVVAPPWTGKTFVSDQLDNALNLAGKLHRKVTFERPPATVKPPWWDSWRSEGGQAWWIIDAVDEDERRNDCQIDEILGLLEELTEEERCRIHVLFFCRESEVPSRFLDRARSLFGTWSANRPSGLRRLRLAGLDRDSAIDLVGEGAFEHVCRLIEANDLQEVAALPAVLESLKKCDPSRLLDRREVWRGVLLGLLREPRGSGRPSVSPVYSEDLFEVSRRLAAVLTFSDRREGWGADFETLIHPDEKEFRILREAAREAVRTAVFEPGGEGFRFAQDHVREWFAAFALQDLPLAKAKPLLTVEDGTPNPVHAGILELLAKIAEDPALRRWIDEAHGGLLPPSGAVPWTLAEARKMLDRLQELARTSPWGLALQWNEERLARLAAPGLGAEIALRLEESLVVTEQELLLDVALAVGASEVVPAAVRILRDQHLEPRLRTRAADVIAEIGSAGELKGLDSWIRVVGEDDSGADSALSILASALYRKAFWDFETTARFALSRRRPGNDWLQYVLARDLDLDRARRLVEDLLSGRADFLETPLLRRAVVVLLGSGEPGEATLKLLWALALREADGGLHHGNDTEVLGALQRSPGSRRKFFLYGLAQDPDQQKEAWRWRSVLKGEDVEWLLDVLCERGGDSGWLRQILYFLSRYKNVSRSLRRKVRRSLESWDAAQVQQLDRLQRSWKEKERRRRRRAEGDEILDVAPLVRSTLDDQDLDLRGKMLRLSWSCFVKPSFRPTNVRGQWDDLGVDLQGEVLELCRNALAACEPTPISEGSAFPVRILWETACFGKLLVEDSGTVLTPELIRKWLPAVLHTWETDWKAVLQKCLDVDRELSETLIVEAILRDLRKEPEGTSYTVQQLLPGMWSERLAARLVEEVVLVPAVSPKARIDLLARISRVYVDRAAEVARQWADEATREPELQETGIDILLAAEPEEGWTRLAMRMREKEAKPVLLRMRSLLPHYAGPKADFEAWPPGLLEQLAASLQGALPPHSDPERTIGQVYDLREVDDLRSLRDAIPALLLRRNREGDSGALERLAQAYPAVRLWLDQTRAKEGAEGVLVALGSARPVPSGTIPVEKIVRLLQDSRYRLLRTADDLQAVVLEELRAIALDAKNHLAMLYRLEGKQRRRLPEEALQAYLLCRLTDRLSRGTLEPHPVIVLNREPLATRNMRNDIKIEALSFDNRLLTLIIEIKWSDNVEMSTSLVEQLGTRYLKESGLTHGVYLVGWCGRTDSSLDGWRARLEEQARQFQQEEPGLAISPFILDLSWEISRGTSAGPSRP